MSQNSNLLVDSLNLFFFLILLKQNPQLISDNMQNSNLLNPVLDIEKNNETEKSSAINDHRENKVKHDNKKEKLKQQTFWDELYIHYKKVNYVKIKTMGNGPESTISGYLAKIHDDFITLVQKGEKIYIPINKILTLKLDNANKFIDKNKEQYYYHENHNNYNNINELDIKKQHQFLLPLSQTISLQKFIM